MKLHSIATLPAACLLLLCTVSACNDEPKPSTVNGWAMPGPI